MIDRRSLMALGAVTPLALGVPCLGYGATPEACDLWVVDARITGGSDAVAPGISGQRVVIDGDVTALWRDRLDALWRQPGTVLAGVTRADALFVLERLAWDRGRRVTTRKDLAVAVATDRGRAIYWRITPHHPSMRIAA